ncbi:hypothetical protein [Nonomuraea basaltis]|uniref:hypothetical protein n=1 Tax=Nonomuraea basaltis TaxID=2495887 RepID=UPI00110C67D2|nr:hypothetical protein [Nonomuraea basaltis]TMR90055.1 hypothetical protein EJK15_57360 [Nonomuraea basaltis]
MRSTLKKLYLVTAAAIMMTLPISTGTAYAAETVVNGKKQWLTANPNSGMPMSSFGREIWLKGGTYGWFTYVAPDAIGTCNNYTGNIGEGTYQWNQQIWPGAPSAGYYRIDSYLWHKDGGAAYSISCKIQLPRDGDYVWGSALDPHF